MQSLPPALAALGRWRQFVTYLVVPSRTRPGKTDKFPTDWRTGSVADAHDPAIWCTFEQAVATGRPIGFVITKNDPFFFIDIDSALRPEGWTELATRICEVFAGTAVEVSQSLTGLHILGTLSGEAPAHRTKPSKRVKGLYDGAAGLEFYTSGRFVALTGHSAAGDVAAVVDAVKIDWLVDNFFKPEGGDDEREREDELSTEPRPEWNGPKEDDDLIRRALMSKSASSAFGSGASFADLWTGDVEALAKAYPSGTSDEYDRSAADMALLQHLAFWTGCHGTRMAALVWRSGLVREKWGTHATYLSLSTRVACARQGNVLADKLPDFMFDTSAGPVTAPPVANGFSGSIAAPPAHEQPPAAALPSPMAADGIDESVPVQRPVVGSTFLSVPEQATLFTGCVYVSDEHAVLVPGGDLLQPDRFKVRFGGFTFAMDTSNERTSRNAWEAFTESQALRCVKVDTTCFRPELNFGTIVTNGGRRKVNVYLDPKVPRQEGNPEPFLRHLAKLLPDARDQKILLSYLAACVQRIGVKFQWAPLIQGVEGNGKSFFTECVVNAVGERYTHLPRADQISAQFNPWVRNKLVIGVEDVFVPDQKQETFEILKPMITARRLPIEPKGVDQLMVDVCCNWILNSNHKDGLRKTENDRRIAPLFCAQQHKNHLKRDGLIGPYFASLFEWYRHGGMAVINHFLFTYPIDPEFDPSTGQIAPITTSTNEAIESGRGTVEQYVLEEIEQDKPGFAGGWISSHAFDRLLERHGLSKRVTPIKRRELLQAMGYDWHPGLPEGRPPSKILPDGSRPKLYIKQDHPARQLTTAAEISRAYSQAQVEYET